MRTIDADKLLDILDVMIVGHKSASDVYDVVDGMPTVDAEPVRHGHWQEEIGMIMCSECGDAWAMEQEEEVRSFNYCPNCGARMDGEADA